jgi:hypothetical protein
MSSSSGSSKRDRHDRTDRTDRTDRDNGLRLPADPVATPRFWELHRAWVAVVIGTVLGLLLALVSWPLGIVVFGLGAIGAPAFQILSLELGGLGRLEHSADRTNPLPTASRPAPAGLRPSSRAK